QIGRALADIIAKSAAKAASKTPKSERNGATRVRLVAAIDRSGFVFEPGGFSPRTIAALSEAKLEGRSLAEVASGQRARPEDALATLAQHALADPILVDLTADESTPLIRQALGAGMDVVLANKRPLSGARADSEALLALAERSGRRMLT